MKAHIAQPKLETIFELNQRYGHGYQARMVMEGVFESVLDDEPYTLYDVGSGTAMALREIEKETGYHYEMHEVVRITDEALRVNKDTDLASARIFRDIESGGGEYARERHDVTTAMVDGKEEEVISARGVVLISYFSWLDDHMPKAREALHRYCEYLAMHGYGAGASEILENLLGMDKDNATKWIKETFGKYVNDDAAIIQYIMR